MRKKAAFDVADRTSCHRPNAQIGVIAQPEARNPAALAMDRATLRAQRLALRALSANSALTSSSFVRPTALRLKRISRGIHLALIETGVFA